MFLVPIKTHVSIKQPIADYSTQINVSDCKNNDPRFLFLV